MVEKPQALVGAEDGNRRVELVERRGMRLDVALQFLLRLVKGCHIDGETGKTADDLLLIDVEAAHRALEDGLGAPRKPARLLRLAAVHGIVAEQQVAAAQRLGEVGRFDRHHVGTVEPDKLALLVLDPGRERCRVQHGREALHLL